MQPPAGEVGVAIMVIGTLLLATFVIHNDSSKSGTCSQAVADSTGSVDVTGMRNEVVFNCENMKHIRLVKELGRGWYKVTYYGEYGVSMQVAVTMMRGKYRGMFTRQVLYLQQLNHPNIIRLLGFCFRRKGYKGDSELELDAEMVLVQEYGEEVDLSVLENLPLSRRLDLALQVLDLLIYLDKSPLGPVALRDLHLRHFLVSDNRLKLIDVDLFRNEEPSCANSKGINSSQSQASELGFLPEIKFLDVVDEDCNGVVPCVGGRCVGYNGKQHLTWCNAFLLRHLLLQERDVESSETGTAMQQLRDLLKRVWDASVTAERLREAVLVAGSGLQHSDVTMT